MFCYIHCRDAWNALGDMPKEDAMIAYVEEMKKVSVAGYIEGTKVLSSNLICGLLKT